LCLALFDVHWVCKDCRCHFGEECFRRGPNLRKRAGPTSAAAGASHSHRVHLLHFHTFLYVQEFAAAQCVITVGQVQQWAAAISFVKAAALKHKPSAEELFAQLQESTELGPSVSKIVARQYALFGSTESGAASSAGESAPGVMSTGKLVDAQWSIGATLGHSLRLNNSMDAPQTPLVSLNLAVCSAGGEVQRTPLTLTVSEFRQLHKQLKDAASAMEGL